VTSKPVEVAQVEDYEEQQAEVMLRPPSQHLKCLNAEKKTVACTLQNVNYI